METRTVEEVLQAPGAKLHTVHMIPPGPAARGIAVMVHGYSAHCELHRHVAMALCETGLAVTMYDQRGHGRSEGPRGHIDRFTVFESDLDVVVKRARERAPELPLALVGHSMGGLVALAYVLEGGGAADALVLAAPWIATRVRIPLWKRLPTPVLSRLWPTLSIPNGMRGTDISRNPEVVAGFDMDPLVHHLGTPRFLSEVQDVQERVKAAAASLRTPTLLLVAGQDRIVSSEAALHIARMAGPVIETKVYPDYFHEVYLEPGAAELVTEAAAWVFRKLSSPRAAAIR